MMAQPDCVVIVNILCTKDPVRITGIVTTIDLGKLVCVSDIASIAPHLYLKESGADCRQGIKRLTNKLRLSLFP